MMVGEGTDTYDPTCDLPAHHKGGCRSTTAISQNRLSPADLTKAWTSKHTDFPLAVYFHAWANGKWQEPLTEFAEALGDFDGYLELGVVGAPSRRWEAIETACNLLRPDVIIEHDTGHEAPTLNRLRQYAMLHEGAILYAHTKGAATVEPFRDRWRRSMLARVVKPWRENLRMLENPFLVPGLQAIGCHWLTEAEYPGMFGPMTEPAQDSGFFGGNFWMARCDYLRRLPPCEIEPRWRAESWIGEGCPSVVDLLPGWPHDRRWPEICG